MSHQIPRYQPSIAYLQASIDLAYGIVDEIGLSAKILRSIEQNQQWYQIKLSYINGKVQKLIQNHSQFDENIILQNKAHSLQKKLIATTNFLIEKRIVALYEKVLKFQTCLTKSSTKEIGIYRSTIETILASFRVSVEAYADDMSPETIKKTLKEIRKLIHINSQLLELRFSGYDHKDDGSAVPSSAFLTPFLTQKTNKAPHYRPLEMYFFCKADYRITRIKEYSVCLSQQTNVKIYKGWFETSFKLESSRIDALERASQRAGKAIPDKIAECRLSLSQVQEELSSLWI